MISFPVAQNQRPAVQSPAEIAQYLAQDSQAVRFKKLLIYCSTGVWESQPARLDTVQFDELLVTLQSLTLSWQELQATLARAVHYLNKAAEYTLVAHTLLEWLKPLYPDAVLTPAVDPQRYGPIVQQLMADPDLLRLKKLLLLACTNHWESDRSKVEQMPLLPLIQKLHGLTPNWASLSYLLDHLVTTLSKAAEYRLIADRLIEAFEPLYAEAEPMAPEAITVVEQPLVADPTGAGPTRSEAASSETLRSSTAQKFSTIAEATAALSALLHEQTKRSTGGTSPIAAPILPGSAEREKRSHRFNLRQSIVQASNPLRTKILLFSLLHEPFRIQQHEAMLKDYDLDDLLQLACQTYRQTAQLETALHQVVCQLADPQAYMQSITAMLQAIQRYGSHPSVPPVPGTAADPTYQSEVSQLTRHLHYPIALIPSNTASLFIKGTGDLMSRTPASQPDTAEPPTHG